MADASIRVRLDTLPMSHPSSPFTLVLATVFPVAFSKTFISSIDPTSCIVSSIRKCVSSVPFSLSLMKVSFICCTIWPLKGSLPVSLILAKFSIINPTVGPAVLSTSVSLVEPIFSFVRIAIGKRRSAISMPPSMAPIALVGSAIVFIHHATQTVWHTSRPQHDTRISTLITIRVQQCLRYNLLTIFSVGGRRHCISVTHIAHRSLIHIIVVPTRLKRSLIIGTNRNVFFQWNGRWCFSIDI
mmetsp:Transcript_28536/g.47230  ORF Transcript_28536/g.47230 Transcript_28536/m.47230 type:complete len:242 (-) Transcript_28536:2102-2827(-)